MWLSIGSRDDRLKRSEFLGLALLRETVLLLRYGAARARELASGGVFVTVRRGVGGGGDAGRATAEYF